MSWLNDELPNEWPTKDVAVEQAHFNGNQDERSDDSLNFSTSRSDDSVPIEPTVAIQPNVNTEQKPQWAQAIRPPQRGGAENSQRLTRLFLPPQIPSTEQGFENAIDPSNDRNISNDTTSSQISSLHTTSSHNDVEEAPKGPVKRRLKVFGQPDTFTNERFGNLLSSMGGNVEHNSTSNAFASKTGEKSVDMSANESDADLANDLQNEGRKVLQGLAPFRPNLSAVQESSLDELERYSTGTNQKLPSRRASNDSEKLRAQPRGTENEDELTADFETTSSTVNKFNSSSSQTLESLPPGLSNWDTIGPFHGNRPNADQNSHAHQNPVLHEQQPFEGLTPLHSRNSGLLHSKQSSRTLVGSGNSAKDYRFARKQQQQKQQQQQQQADQFNRLHNERFRSRDPEAEVSMLSIQEPIQMHASDSPLVHDTMDSAIEPAHLSADNYIQRYSNEFSSTSEMPTTNSNESTNLTNPGSQQEYPQQNEITQGQPPTHRPSTQPVHTQAQSTSQPVLSHPSQILNARSRSNLRFRPTREYDMTPDNFARKMLQFETPRRGPSRYSSLQSSATEGRNAESVSTPTNAPTSTSVHSQSTSANDYSIAHKDLSFSAGFEWLAQLIRERSNHLSTKTLEELDSLDLSDSELETIFGLDKFVPNLTTLFLNKNSVRTLQGLPFNLVHLDMSSNRLGNMNIFPACFVSTLILSNNKLESLEPLANLRALSSLDISNNNLKSLRGLENLTALRTLNLRNNKLTSLDVNLGMLVELDAAHNHISAVKLNTPNLESLDLEGNEVVAINEPLPNLRELNIRSNGATIDFKNWQSLETLLFDGNNYVRHLDAVAGILVTLGWEQPAKLRGEAGALGDGKLQSHMLTNIRDLNLAGRQNGWPFPTNGLIFSAQHLDISMCNIRELPINLHETFPFLRSLNLAFNKLDAKCVSVLSKFSKLERVSLFANRIDMTGAQIAHYLPHLRILDTRSQHKGHKLVKPRDYCTEVYKVVMESDGGPTKGSIIKTSNANLQWLDGKWTQNANKRRQTTRPGFSSPLYPEAWYADDEADDDTQPRIAGETVDEDVTVIGGLKAWDLIEAMYAHHFLQSI